MAVELLVERASALGFMLFDVGGWNNRQIRKWIEGIQWHLHQRLASGTQGQSVEQVKQAIPDGTIPPGRRPDLKSSSGSAFVKAFTILLLVWMVILLLFFFVTPVIGLLTGHLYIPGRGSGGFTIHEPWARPVSALVLLIQSPSAAS